MYLKMLDYCYFQLFEANYGFNLIMALKILSFYALWEVNLQKSLLIIIIIIIIIICVRY